MYDDIDDKYLVINIPFENNTDDICKNICNKIGNPIVRDTSSIKDIDNNIPFDKAIYFDKNSILKVSYNSKSSITLRSFLLSFYIYSDISDVGYFYNIIKINDIINFTISPEYDSRTYYYNKIENSDDALYSYNTDDISIWHKVIYKFNPIDNKIYAYVDDKLTYVKYLEYYEIPTNLFISIGSNSNISDNYGFYIRNFKIYDNYDVFKKEIILDTNTSKNTVINITMRNNIEREVSWSRKTIAYVLNPRFFKR